MSTIPHCLVNYAQTSELIELENNAVDVFKGVTIQLPEYREINGGSKFIVKYSGAWPEEMKGAFEYAIKIWEEVLPTSLPINVTAELGTIRGSRDVISKVGFFTYNFDGDFDKEIAAPSSMIKHIVLREQHRSYQERFISEITDSTFFKNEDIKITYNESLKDQFSFSLDGEPNEDKYDFVTVVLRDIAMGLGFGTNFTADVTSGTMNLTDARKTPYEQLIFKALDTENPTEAYSRATLGTLEVKMYDGIRLDFNTFTLYAPTEWKNGVSLRSLIPNEKDPMSRLLTYDFGKGYIMRDLSGINWQEYFAGTLDWNIPVRTGAASVYASQEGHSTDILPYRGNAVISFDNTRSDYFSESISDHNSYTINRISNKSISPEITEYCKRFNYFSPTDYVDMYTKGISICALLNNGEWDELYRDSHMMGAMTLSINLENLKLHYDESQYARGTTGGLRYRITNCIGDFDNLYGFEKDYYTVKYYTRDYTPEKPKIKYSKILNEYSSEARISPQSDEYFIDVVIGIRNIEGAKRVIVQQLDEGETLPFEYEAYDFRKGYFIANLDRELSTNLYVVSYNDNGAIASETINIPPMGYPDVKLTYSYKRTKINIGGIPEELKGSNELTCTVSSVAGTSDGMPIFKSLDIVDGSVDISSLPRGTFVMTIKYKNQQIGLFRFIRTLLNM